MVWLRERSCDLEQFYAAGERAPQLCMGSECVCTCRRPLDSLFPDLPLADRIEAFDRGVCCSCNISLSKLSAELCTYSLIGMLRKTP